MKAQFLSVLTALAFIGFVSSTPVLAEENAPTDQSQHEGHHTDTTAKAPTSPSKMDSNNDMMGKMNMEQMKGMMHECMETKKDGKMCDHDMMEKCHGEMSKSDCKKMMKHAKSQSELTKKK